MPANSTFSGPITSTFNAVPFDKSPFTCQCKNKEHRKAEGFQIVHFDWSFSSDIMAVKGLNHCTMLLEPVMCQEPVNPCTGIA